MRQKRRRHTRGLDLWQPRFGPDAPFSDLEELKAAQPYKAWQAGEGIPSVTGHYVEDLGTVDVKPWARYGVLGSFVNLEGTGGVNDLHVLELPAGASTNPVSHMYEALAM